MRKPLESRRRKLWKRGITTLLAFCLVSVWVLAGTFTSFAQEGTITASSAKIRREASTSSEAIGSALSGQKVTINSTIQGSDGKTWYQVTVNGMTGYIRSDLLRADGDNSNAGSNAGGNTSTPVMNPTVAVTALTPQTATVATGTAGVRVRTDASTASSIITSLQNNAAITILGQATGADGNVWYQVSFSLNGAETQGFIRNDYVKLPDGAALTPRDSEPTADPSTETPSEENGTDTGEESQQPAGNDSKEYDTQLKANSSTGEDTWYLLDYANNKQYPIADLIAAGTGNAAYLQKMESKVTTQKIIILVLVVIIIAAALAITLLYFKLRDADDAYYAAVEKQTIRDRNAAKAQGGRTSSDRVMQTVGSTGRQERGTQSASAGSRPAGARPVQGSSQPAQRSAGSTRPVQGGSQNAQRPAGARPVQGGGQNAQRSAGARPVQGGGQTVQRPAGSVRPAQNSGQAGARPIQGSSQTAQRPTQGGGQTVQRPVGSVRPAQAAQSTARPAASREAEKTQPRQQNQVQDDDEFEFEFLNWDGEENK